MFYHFETIIFILKRNKGSHHECGFGLIVGMLTVFFRKLPQVIRFR
jgi:hypothetical protein